MRRSQIPDYFAQDLFPSALKSLAHALQAKDPYTAGHALRVSLVAKAVAQELGLSPPEVRQIGFAAELHDIGKIGVSERLLHKRGRLTDYEYDEVMRHTIIGEQIVAPLMGVDLTVREVVRWHHERMNGTGTPDGLSGDEIPLAARVVAVADAFDAMTSGRPYRAALSLDAARRELLENAGTQFDPECVEALVRRLSPTPHSPLPPGSGEWGVGSGRCRVNFDFPIWRSCDRSHFLLPTSDLLPSPCSVHRPGRVLVSNSIPSSLGPQTWI